MRNTVTWYQNHYIVPERMFQCASFTKWPITGTFTLYSSRYECVLWINNEQFRMIGLSPNISQTYFIYPWSIYLTFFIYFILTIIISIYLSIFLDIYFCMLYTVHYVIHHWRFSCLSCLSNAGKLTLMLFWFH